MHELSYTHMDKWLETGEERPVTRRCRAAIDDIKAKGRFKDRIFVIVRAVAADSLTFDFSRALKGSIGVSADFTEQLTARLRGKGELKDGTRLKITDPLFVGYASPDKIDEWLPTGHVSGEIVKVRSTPTTLEIEKVGGGT
jgi:hypothetical protein